MSNELRMKNHSQSFINLISGQDYCPGKEAAMGSIVVSLPCTTYLWGYLIMLSGKTTHPFAI